jgi:hypothetical protein
LDWFFTGGQQAQKVLVKVPAYTYKVIYCFHNYLKLIFFPKFTQSNVHTNCTY